jgi:hypothetical protein
MGVCERQEGGYSGSLERDYVDEDTLTITRSDTDLGR